MTDDPAGKSCKLKNDTRVTSGAVHTVTEILTIKRKVNNLEREMLLVMFPDTTTAFVFPNEVDIIE